MVLLVVLSNRELHKRRIAIIAVMSLLMESKKGSPWIQVVTGIQTSNVISILLKEIRIILLTLFD